MEDISQDEFITSITGFPVSPPIAAKKAWRWLDAFNHLKGFD